LPKYLLKAAVPEGRRSGTAAGKKLSAGPGFSSPEIFPVNYVVQGPTVLFRTAEGTTLISAAINNHVVFEADAHNVAAAAGVLS